MKILSIETSCDETGVTILEGIGDRITILGNALASQIELHAQYGGVFPALAKRAHAEKIIPLLKEALSAANLLRVSAREISTADSAYIQELFPHDEALVGKIIDIASHYEIPAIDYVAVTSGPGLEPALWVGVNTARALAHLWSKPLYPINHMEGHVVSALFKQTGEKTYSLEEFEYPALSLLVSGGHTELVLIDSPLSYKKIGATRDDAVGEAFDKVARILGLPYPGGPKISALALDARRQSQDADITFPRPMLHSQDYDFSYSGLKTAVLYYVRDLAKEHPNILKNVKMISTIAREFEEAAIEVLVTKTKKAIEEYNVQTLLVGGGVAANTYLREQLSEKISVPILFPTRELSTDNSIMIGMALYYQLSHGKEKSALENLEADGNLSL